MVTSSRNETRTAWKPSSGVHDGGELITGSVTRDVEHRNDHVLVPLELLLGAERQPTDPRMQSIRSYDKIEVAWLPIFE